MTEPIEAMYAQLLAHWAERAEKIYTMHKDEKRSYVAIAKEMGISKQRVLQIYQATCLAKLQKEVENNGNNL